MGRNGDKKFCCPPNVGHSEKSRAPFWQVGGSAPPRPPGRGRVCRCLSAGHRAPSRESGGVWRQWSMDHGQNCRDESATDLPRSPAVRFPAQIVRRGHLVPFRGPRPPGPKNRTPDVLRCRYRRQHTIFSSRLRALCAAGRKFFRGPLARNNRDRPANSVHRLGVAGASLVRMMA